MHKKYTYLHWYKYKTCCNANVFLKVDGESFLCLTVFRGSFKDNVSVKAINKIIKTIKYVTTNA
jgi:hypothetical protein